MADVFLTTKNKLLLLLIFEILCGSMSHPVTRRRIKQLMKVNMFDRQNLQLTSPTNNLTRALYSKNNYYLAEGVKSKLVGIRTFIKELACFELQSIDKGVIRIKNIYSGNYIAMNKYGQLRMRKNPFRRPDEYLFHEIMEQHNYVTYASHRYYKNKTHDLFIGMKKDGNIRPARKDPTLNTVSFLPEPKANCYMV